MRSKGLFRLLVVGLVMASLAMPGWGVLAQASVNLAITEIDDRAFPQITTLMTVSDATGLPITGLGASAFSVAEDGNPVEDFTVVEFQNTDEPIAFVLAIDISGSMIGEALEDTKVAAEGFIEGLTSTDQVGLVTFGDTALTIAEVTEDKDATVQAVRELTAGGYTAMYDAVILSCEMLETFTAGRRAIVMITDGENVRGEVQDEDAALVCPLRETIPVYTIGFGDDVDEAMLAYIAEQTGGIDQVKPDSEGMMAEFATVLQHLRQQYRLEFDSGFMANDAVHTLTISVDHGGMQAQVEGSFISRVGVVSISLIGMDDGQDVGGSVQLEVAVVSPGELQPINVTLGGDPLATLTEEDPFYTWDTMALAEGEVVLVVSATDDIGNTGSREYRLNVRRPVRITWETPLAGDQISGATPLSVTLDTMFGVAKVEYYADGALLGTVNADPFDSEWDLKGVSPGPHVLRAVATDVNSYTAEAEIQINVAITSNTWIIALAIAILVAAALLIIPLAARRRRGLSVPEAAPGVPIPSAAVPLLSGSLLELEGLNPGRDWRLADEEVRIGRKREDNDIQAAGISASRQHAVIRKIEGQYVLSDLRPDNPSYVNGQPIHEQCVLATGDTIQIGDSIFRFEGQT